jgi:hemerythrin superfamily protein
MDIYEIIVADHEKARGLLDQIKKTKDTDGEKRSKLFADLKPELMMHQHVEEGVFYSKLKEIEDTRDDALEAINEHHVVDGLLEELDAMPTDNDEWRAKFGVLKELVEHHMREEEEEFLPGAKKVLDEDLAREMADVYQQKKAAGLDAMEPMRTE